MCLSGECADELFGGYPWYHREEILFEDTFPWSRSVGLRLGLLAPDVVRDGAAFVREHYLSTCRRAEKLPSDSKKDARMREMFVLNLDWFMATLLEGSVAGGYSRRYPRCSRGKRKRGASAPLFLFPSRPHRSPAVMIAI